MSVCSNIGYMVSSCYTLINLIGGGKGNNNKNQGNGRGHPSVFVASVGMNSDSNNNSSWILDCGATHHITNDASCLSNVTMFFGFDGTTIDNGGTLPITHIEITHLVGMLSLKQPSSTLIYY